MLTSAASPGAPVVIATRVYVPGISGEYSTQAQVRFQWATGDFTGLTGTPVYRLQILDKITSETPIGGVSGVRAYTTVGVLSGTTGDTIPLPTAIPQWGYARVRAELLDPAVSFPVSAVDTAANSLTVTGSTAVTVGDMLQVSSTGTIPGGLAASTNYYVFAILSASAGLTRFTVTATDMGSGMQEPNLPQVPLDITSAGSGTITITLKRQVSPWVSYGEGSEFFFSTGTSPATSDGTVTPLLDFIASLTSSTAALAQWVPGASYTEVMVSATSETPGAVAVARTVNSLNNDCLLTGLTPDALYRITAHPRVTVAANPSTLATYYPHDGLMPAVSESWLQTIEPDESTGISGPQEVQLRQGLTVGEQWYFFGLGAVEDWKISGQPSGLTIDFPTNDRRLARLNGEPADAGVFASVVSCRRHFGFARRSFYQEVLIAVTGGLCLSWLHRDPQRVDLQSFASREIGSFIAGDTPLYLKRGDECTLSLLFRSGTRAKPGQLISPVSWKSVEVTISRPEDLDAEPYLTLSAPVTGGVVTTASIDGNVFVPLSFTVKSAALDRQFRRLNNAPGAEPASVELPGLLEITYTTAAGETRSSRSFPVTIAQDQAW